MIGRIANHWHKSLSRDPPVKIGVPDPVSYESLLQPHWHGGWIHHHAHPPDAAAFPTLASLLFLLEATDRPVSLDGIAILPEPSAEPAKQADPDKPPPRLMPVQAAGRVVRPSVPRQELFDAIVASRWRRKAPAAATPAKPAAETPEKKPGEGDGKKTHEKKEELTEDDGLGKFEDLLTPDAK